MDETSIETTEPIFELATECETLFSDHLSMLENESDFNGAKVVGEYQQRFSAWAAFLGVFAVPEMCLDRRLRSHVEIQDLVLRLLDIMKRNLVHLFEEDIDIPDLDQVSPAQIRVNLESLRGIEGAVDRLNHLGRTIQRSSEAGQATKVDKFTTSFDSTSFEEIARLAMKSFYPDASASLLNQLIQAMTDMYEKFHYRRSRQVRLQARPKAALFTIGEDSAANPTAKTDRASPRPTAPPILDANKQLPHLISMTHLEDRSHKSRESNPTSLDSREFSRLFSRQGGGSVGSKTRSILVSQVAYPQPSEESLVCEWCFATLSKDELKGEKWKAQDLSEHILKLHDDIFTKPQIQVIVHQSQLRSPRPQDMCPLCCLSMRDEQGKEKEEQHLKVARPDFSSKDQTPGKSPKRVKTETGSTRQAQYGSLEFEGEMREMIPDTGTKTAEDTQRVGIESIARHVAAHLQGIMLFTLRMMSLDISNATADEKSLSSSTNHDSSRAGEEQQRFKEETGAFVDMSEEQANSMEIDDPSIQDTIPDCEHIVDWQDQSVAKRAEERAAREVKAREAEERARASIGLPRNEHFVCPEDLFGRIAKQSSEPASCVALVGLGGMGKSQLALEFAHRTAAESPEVWAFWIHAGTLEDIEEGFRRIAECIKLPAQNVPWDDLYQLVCDWLYDEQNGPWILILDGADDPSVFYKISDVTNVLRSKRRPIGSLYLLKSLRRNSSIIVTTRNKDLAGTLTRGHGSIIEVGPMPVVEATSLFRKILGPKFQPASDMNAAIHFVKGLGLNPLAITQAALYLDKYLPKATTLANYLKKLEENTVEKARLLNFDANSIFKTWEAAFDFIRSQRPSAANILSLMSYFDRRGIPKWLLVSDIRDNNNPRANSPSIMGRLELDDSEGDINDDSTDTFDGDIDMLMNYCIIAANRTRDMFEMHALVQLAARASMSNTEAQKYCAQFIHRLAAEFPSNPLGYWSTCQELFAHVQAAAKYSPSDDALEDWAILLYDGGRYARLLGDYETAKHMSNKVSKAREMISEEEQTEREAIRLLENSSLTALILMDQGLYHEAEGQFTHVTDTFKRMEARWETARSNTLTSMNNLASVYRVQGRWKEAEKLLTQVRYHRAELNKVGASALATLANLASTYRAQGRYVEATALQEVVLESCKTQLGEGHPQTLTNKSNLASLYRIQGELEKAEELQIQAMNGRDMKFGREHPDTLTSMNGLASIFRAQGRLWEAEELQVQVVELRRTKLGENHPNTMASMNNLALIFYEQGKGEKAIELQSLVVDMCKVKFGDSHPHTLTSINNLALIRKSQGQHQDAMRLMKSCSDNRQDILGPKHPYTISSMAALRRWIE
ncbi:hypothetical protein TGAM01_v207358 [Trichoderma gamsii]|uniref:NB-ARC domain-containing protein n=1 Tax=Trichoderma gamsii TaxID=398673 RepID=A0A2P4ZHF1_9HYPO|nr:hypothetical protein TGAM01_v207358 [Trichoderma gamsii]PON23711.1 hypothetical protein TGAM01_v207358 [Trichoderma gamsii]